MKLRITVTNADNGVEFDDTVNCTRIEIIDGVLYGFNGLDQVFLAPISPSDQVQIEVVSV